MVPSIAFLVASFATGSSLAATIPLSPGAGQGKTFSLKVGHIPGAKINCPRILATLDEKTVAAKSCEDESEYFVEVDIGSPPQKMRLNLDTGSGDLWVASSLIPKKNRPESIYEIQESDVPLKDSTFEVKYGDKDQVSGDVYLETVSIGELEVKSQAVGMAKSTKGDFFDASSGFLGLSMDKVNSIKPQKQPTWFSNIKSQLAAPLFTANLKRDAPGNYNFGYIDETEYTGDITYAPHIDDKGHWEIEIDGFSFGDGPRVESKVRRSTIDTGTAYIMLADEEIVKQYYKSFKTVWNDKAENWIFSCKTKVPDFSFWLGDKKVAIPGSIMNRGSLDEAEKWCYGALEIRKGIRNLFGILALQSLFVVFDASEAKRIGFASKPI